MRKSCLQLNKPSAQNENEIQRAKESSLVRTPQEVGSSSSGVEYVVKRDLSWFSFGFPCVFVRITDTHTLSQAHT